MFIINLIFWLLALIYLLYFNENYEIFVFQKRLDIEIMFIIISVYLIFQLASIYIKNGTINLIKLIYGYLINISFGFLFFKILKCEWYKEDIIIQNIYIKIIRIYNEQEYINIAEDILFHQNITILKKYNLTVSDIYKIIKPENMHMWKEKFTMYMEKLQEDYDLLKEMNLEILINSKISSVTNLFGIPGGKYIFFGLIVVGLSVFIYGVYNTLIINFGRQSEFNKAVKEEFNHIDEVRRMENELLKKIRQWLFGEHKVIRENADGSTQEFVFKGIDNLINDLRQSIVDLRLDLGIITDLLVKDIKKTDNIEKTLYYILTLLLIVYNEDIPRMQDDMTEEEKIARKKQIMLILDIIYQELNKKFK